MRRHLPPGMQLSEGIRLALYCFVVIAVSPIRYWPLMWGLDPTWVFTLNYAAAHGVEVGRDIFFTFGPLAYLTFPQAIGHNLEQALIFQACLWIFLGWEMAALFFRSNLRIGSLALFAFFFALSTPLYSFGFCGVENLILVVTLLELTLYRMRGAPRHYVLALVSLCFTPLIKLSAGIIAASAMVGFLAARVLQDGRKAKREIVLALLVPVAVAACVLASVAMSGRQALFRYLHSAADLIGGYSTAMSYHGAFWEVVTAGVSLAGFALLLLLHARDDPRWAGLSICTFAGPVLLSFKHGFVRQDTHVLNYFGFMALATSLVLLKVQLKRHRAPLLGGILVVLTASWGFVNFSEFGVATLYTISGLHNAHKVWRILKPAQLRRSLSPSTDKFDVNQLIEPEIRAMVGNTPVASLSDNYSVLGGSGWNPRFYPIIQMYSAYTPYLDGLNAAWIRDHGPPFLMYDGVVLDDRNSWAAAPATWLEVYRWYETRLPGPRNLLLQRRTEPRFRTLDSIDRFTVRAPLSMSLPPSDVPVFWSLRCGSNLTGTIRKALFRIPESEMRIDEAGVLRRERIIPEMLGTPIMGSYLPSTLAQFAAVFEPNGRIPAVRRIAFGGPGIGNYASTCEGELLRPR